MESSPIARRCRNGAGLSARWAWPVLALVFALVFAAGCRSASTMDAPDTERLGERRAERLGEPGGEAPSPEGAAAITVAEATLAALSAGDTSALRDLLYPAARLAAIGEDSSTPPRISDLTQFLASVSSPDADFLERMWNPSVLVDGRLATVWTPYDFYRAGEFSHCGIDVFNLVHDGSRWRVLSISYTVHPRNCPESPLAPPG